MTATARASALPVGATLDRGFDLIKRRPRAILVPAVLLHVVPMIAAVLLALLGVLLLGDIETTSEQVRESTFFGDSTLETRDVASLTDGQWITVAILGVVAGLTMIWFTSAAYASMIFAARRADEGKSPLPLGAALRESLRAAPRLFALTLIAFVAVVVAAGLAILLLRSLNRVGGLPLFGAATLALLCAALVIGLRLLLFPVVALVEHRGLDAFARTWRLSAGRFWPLLGLTLLLLVTVTAIYVVVALVLEALFGALNAVDTAVGPWLLVPYAGLLLVLSVIYAAGLLAPLVVAHRGLVAVDDDPGTPKTNSHGATSPFPA